MDYMVENQQNRGSHLFMKPKRRGKVALHLPE